MNKVLLLFTVFCMAIAAHAQDVPYSKYLNFSKTEFKDNHFKYDSETNTWALRKRNGLVTTLNILAIIADGYAADKPYDINTYEKGGETRYSAGFAAGTTVSKSNDYNTTITYTVAPTFTVTIPASVTLGEDATISAENVVVPKGKQVEVSIAEANGFKATTPEGAEITYTVKNGEDAVAEGETVLAVNPKDGKTGSTTLSFVAPETIQYAGTYTGTVTFTVVVKDAPKPIINFTIDGTSYQADAGMTWAEWIESASNTIGLYLSDSADGVYWDWLCLIDATGAVKASDVIEAEAYTLIQTEC